MDFTGQYAFPASHQAGFHQFMPVPPLTPSHSQSAPSDEYNNSPPDAYDHVPANDQFHNFDYPQSFHPPPPPQQQQNHGFVGHSGPPTPPSQTQQHLGNGATNGAFNGNIGHMSGDMMSQAKSEADNSNGQGSEEDLTPAQSKRKAQNRAAQRAFRERKERHVKDLETKLADLEAAQQQASFENERLKRDLQKMTTENEILKATSSSNANGQTSSHSPEPMTTGPMRYSPTDFATSVLANHDNKSFSHRIAYSKDGQRLLAAGASWDFIISHELFKQGLVDIGSVSDHLKSRAICDGQGPVFSESDLLQAIDLSIASGTDDLL